MCERKSGFGNHRSCPLGTGDCAPHPPAPQAVVQADFWGRQGQGQGQGQGLGSGSGSGSGPGPRLHEGLPLCAVGVVLWGRQRNPHRGQRVSSREER